MIESLPANDNSSAPQAQLSDYPLSQTLDKWNLHTAVNNIISTSHPGTLVELLAKTRIIFYEISIQFQISRISAREKGPCVIFACWQVIEDMWVMISWPLAGEGVISHIYIFQANILNYFSARVGITASQRPVQRSNDPIHIYYNIRYGVRPLVMKKLVQGWSS